MGPASCGTPRPPSRRPSGPAPAGPPTTWPPTWPRCSRTSSALPGCRRGPDPRARTGTQAPAGPPIIPMVRRNPGPPPNTLRAPFPALSHIRRPWLGRPEPLKTSLTARPAAPGVKTPENPQGRLIPPVLRPGPAILKLNSDAASGKRDPRCQRPSPKGTSPRSSSRRDWTRPNRPKRKRPE